MPQPEWEALEREVRDLAGRVSLLEHRLGQGQSMAAAPAATVPQTALSHPLQEVPAMLPLVGRALLGLAGAYLLRALTEAGALPRPVGIAAGIIYALAWLLWAARTPATEKFAAVLHTITAVLVFSPLLWEAAGRFHAIDAWTAAGVLFAFAAFGMAIAWRKRLLIVSTLATLASLGTGAALLIATHDVLPFTLMFLGIAAAIEVSACLDHWLNERWLGGAAADLSVILATWLVTNSRGVPQGYPDISHTWLLVCQVALLTIYLSSVIVRTLFRGYSFTTFETAQCALTFGIAMSAGLAPVLLFCAAACYLVSFARPGRADVSPRNFYTYSTFAILLTLAGSRTLFSGTTATVWLILAVACMGAGSRFGRSVFHVHGTIYLALALVASGALQAAMAFLLGAASWPGDRQAVLWAGFAAALCCYLLVARNDRTSAGFRIVPAAILVWLAAGIAAGVLTAGYHSLFGVAASQAYCAVLRTTVLAGGSLLLAWAGPHWKRSELARLVYPAMLLGGYRLLTQDLHQEATGALFLSLVVYGAALIALPRLKRSTA